MNAAEELIAEARHGRFGELLPRLQELGTGSEAAGTADAWEAAAAAVQILFWYDRFAEAAELAEALITRDGPLGGELCDQDMPFGVAFLAAQAHAGIPAGPRLTALAAHVPEGRVLGDDLMWLAEEVPGRPVEELLPNHADWGGPARPLDGVIGADLVERDFGTLDAGQKRVVWQALAKVNDFERAHELAEASGETPEQFAVCTWLAGWYGTRGDIARGESMLLAAHGRWWPYAKWDAIPDAPVLQPALRSVATERVRAHYLTRPIGPEAAETNA
ncbi:hypothetical protein ACFYZ8_12735 [Streptomyces sp. NPDC001668]|uniref:hypothetical protein n=1 Tax=unclassified Streptomyces TaxID=2593676 RepID=UPI00369D5D54